MVGKTGVGIAAGAPIAFSALDGFQNAAAEMRKSKLGIVGAITTGAWSFLNGLSQGFGMGPVNPNIQARNVDGALVSLGSQTTVPAGAWFKTSIIGGTLVAWDILVSFASRKLAKVSSGVRFMGTKLTGGK